MSLCIFTAGCVDGELGGIQKVVPKSLILSLGKQKEVTIITAAETRWRNIKVTGSTTQALSA